MNGLVEKFRLGNHREETEPGKRPSGSGFGDGPATDGNRANTSSEVEETDLHRPKTELKSKLRGAQQKRIGHRRKEAGSLRCESGNPALVEKKQNLRAMWNRSHSGIGPFRWKVNRTRQPRRRHPGNRNVNDLETTLRRGRR